MVNFVCSVNFILSANICFHMLYFISWNFTGCTNYTCFSNLHRLWKVNSHLMHLILCLLLMLFLRVSEDASFSLCFVLCVRWYNFRLPDWEKVKSHVTQQTWEGIFFNTNGLVIVRSPVKKNYLSHWKQPNGFSPWWDGLCLFSRVEL